jgi:hypothetical protein
MTNLTTFFLVLFVYIIGAILAYGRAYAEFKDIKFALCNSLLSWIAFLFGAGFWKQRTRFLQFRPVVAKRKRNLEEDLEFAEKHME